MNIDLVLALVAGAVIPLIIALFGRESIGKLLLGKQVQESTALGTLIDMTKEAVAGWRESTMAITQLVRSVDTYQTDAERIREQIFEKLQRQEFILANLEERLVNLLDVIRLDSTPFVRRMDDDKR